MSDPVRGVLGRLKGVKQYGSGWMARCPAHEDGTASLSISEGREGAVLHCHAGCSPEAIVAALGLAMTDLFADPKENSARSEIIAAYDYTSEDGELLYQVVRFGPKKDFRQRRPDGRGGWHWKLGDVRRVLYRLPEVLEAVSLGKPIYVAEGEKDVDAIRDAGGVATCNAGGAGKWKPAYNDALRGANVIVIADKDEPGREHARAVAEALRMSEDEKRRLLTLDDDAMLAYLGLRTEAAHA
jgi:hypothetical protein